MVLTLHRCIYFTSKMVIEVMLTEAYDAEETMVPRKQNKNKTRGGRNGFGR